MRHSKSGFVAVCLALVTPSIASADPFMLGDEDSAAVVARTQNTGRRCSANVVVDDYYTYYVDPHPDPTQRSLHVREFSWPGTCTEFSPHCSANWGVPSVGGVAPSDVTINGHPALTNGVVALPIYRLSMQSMEIWVRDHTYSETSYCHTSDPTWEILPRPNAPHWIVSAPAGVQMQPGSTVGYGDYFFARGSNSFADNEIIAYRKTAASGWTWQIWGTATAPNGGIPLAPAGQRFVSQPAVAAYSGGIQLWIFSRDAANVPHLLQQYTDSNGNWLPSWIDATVLPSTYLPATAPTVIAGTSNGVPTLWVAYAGRDAAGTSNPIFVRRYANGWGSWVNIGQPGGSSSTSRASIPAFVNRPTTEMVSILSVATPTRNLWRANSTTDGSFPFSAWGNVGALPNY